MIVDHYSNLNNYTFLNPHIKTVIDFIKQNDLTKLPIGKTEIDGKNVYVLHEQYDPRPLASCYFEGHHHYADIQLVLSGKEAIGYRYKWDTSNAVVTASYDESKDVEKYDIKDFTKVILTSGMFALVNPDDLHMPKLRVEDSSFVDKIVFKIKV